MTRERHIKIHGPYAMFSRVLSFVLLSFIVWGTTIQAAHQHAGPSEARQSAQANAFSERGKTTANDSSLSGCGDCLICQLHQDFSVSLVIERDSSAPPKTHLEISHANSDVLRTRTDAPRAGRAPPLA